MPIQLKNLDLSNVTLDKQYEKVIEENDECLSALRNLDEGIGDKEYLKEHYIEEMLDQFQANISMASFYGISAEDIMNYYNTKFLEKLKHRPRD